MLITWLIAISVISILLLIAAGVLSALSLNSMVNGNENSARNFAWWSVGVTAIGILLLIILLFVYAWRESTRAVGIFTIGILAILLLAGALFLSIFAARGTVSPVVDYPLWSAVLSFAGALIILFFVIFYTYVYWFEIVSELYQDLAGSLEGFRQASAIKAQEIPIYTPRGKVLLSKPPATPRKSVVIAEPPVVPAAMPPVVPAVVPPIGTPKAIPRPKSADQDLIARRRRLQRAQAQAALQTN